MYAIQFSGPGSSAFSSVDFSEMSFAIALFVAAADGRIRPRKPIADEFSICEIDSREASGLSPRIDDPDNEDYRKLSNETPLGSAVSVVWEHYEGDQRRKAICWRLIAFYAMMNRTGGANIARWTRPSMNDPSTAVLNPAVIAAVASAHLEACGQFDGLKFMQRVEGTHTRDSRPLAGAGFPNSDDSIEPLTSFTFRIFEKLTDTIISMSGETGASFSALASFAQDGA